LEIIVVGLHRVDGEAVETSALLLAVTIIGDFEIHVFYLLFFVHIVVLVCWQRHCRTLCLTRAAN